jgi:Tol biopolymer transport system component
VKRADYAFVAWNPVLVTVGESLWSDATWRSLPLDWRPEQIRNCSYAPEKRWIGISATDATRGDDCLAIVDRDRGATIHRFGVATTLDHALTNSGRRAALVTATRGIPSGSLRVVDVDRGDWAIVLTSGVHHGSTLSWFPDSDRIAIQSAVDTVQVVSTETGSVSLVAPGIAPAVDPSGRRIAFVREGRLFVWDVEGERAFPVAAGTKPIAVGPSWSPDAQCVSFSATTGLVGKETAFFLHHLESGSTDQLPIRYQTGMALIPGDVDGD